MVPASTTHYVRQHSIHVRVYIVRTGARGSPVEYVWMYECVRTHYDVRMAYLGEYMHLFGADDFLRCFALFVFYSLPGTLF